jgi:hypothetical protein
LFLLEARSVAEREWLACIIGSAGLSVYRLEQWSNQFRDAGSGNFWLINLNINQIALVAPFAVQVDIRGHTSARPVVAVGLSGNRAIQFVGMRLKNVFASKPAPMDRFDRTDWTQR